MNDGTSKTKNSFPGGMLGSICHFGITVIVTLSSVTQLAVPRIDHLESYWCMTNKWDGAASYTVAVIEDMMVSLEENLKGE